MFIVLLHSLQYLITSHEIRFKFLGSTNVFTLNFCLKAGRDVMNVKLVLPVLILCVIAFKFVYFISDWFRSVKQFSREVSRQETSVSRATA